MSQDNLSMFATYLRNNRTLFVIENADQPFSFNDNLVLHFGIMGASLYYAALLIVIFLLLYVTAINLEQILDIDIVDEVADALDQLREDFRFEKEKNK